MEYKNITLADVKFPVKIVGNQPVWYTIKAGESKELPESAYQNAQAHGLLLVEKEEPKPVEAEESSIGRVRVETKKVKSKRRI